MGIFDFIKKKKVEKQVEKKTETHPLPKEKPRRKVSRVAYYVLASPHVTEKATGLEKENKYIFKVLPKTNKIEIKKAIEDLYGVDVIGVKVINIPRRQRRIGKQRGWRKGYKKAIVKIKTGQKIEILPR